MTGIEAAIISALEERCKVGAISKKTLIADLALDSLMYMNMIVDIETMLNASLDDEAIIQVLTVENVGELCYIFSN